MPRADGAVTDAIAAAADILVASRHAIALTGAGISVESGIPPFRGPDGLWTKHEPPSPDGYRKFLEDPEAWWRHEIERSVEPWIQDLRRSVRDARPNPGHVALAGLEAAGLVRATITQNIDGLHQDAGSRRVIELHGSRRKFRCVGCGRRTPRPTMYPTRPAPPCEKCGGPVKYDSVMFGEPIPPEVLRAARAEVDAADCVLVIGSSSTVRPAGGLPRIAKVNGAMLIEVNPAPTGLTGISDAVVRDTAASALPALLEAATAKAAARADAGYDAGARRRTRSVRQVNEQ